MRESKERVLFFLSVLYSCMTSREFGGPRCRESPSGFYGCGRPALGALVFCLATNNIDKGWFLNVGISNGPFLFDWGPTSSHCCVTRVHFIPQNRLLIVQGKNRSLKLSQMTTAMPRSDDCGGPSSPSARRLGVLTRPEQDGGGVPFGFTIPWVQ